MKNKGRVYFGLWGNFSPTEATDIIGVEPTETWFAHERFPERKLPKESIWDYSTDVVEDEIVDVYELSKNIVDDLKPHATKIKEFVESNNLRATLKVVLHISPDETVSTPIIGFDRQVIDFLSEVGATVDIDTYRNYEKSGQGRAD